MCTLAPRAAAGHGATAFLDGQRGVVASAVARPAKSWRHHNSEAPAASARKRGRHDDDRTEHDVVVDPSSALRSRMDKELVALQGLLKRGKLLPRSAPAAEKKPALSPRLSVSEPPAVSSAAKRTTTASQIKRATEAATPVHSKQQQPAVVQSAAAAKTAEVSKKRRPEEEEKELARAAARAAFRQMLVEMEKSALKDETVYPEEMEELGIPFEFLVTRTWKQAMLEYHANKVDLVGV